MLIKIVVVALFAAGTAYAWLNGWLCRREDRYEREHAGLTVG